MTESRRWVCLAELPVLLRVPGGDGPLVGPRDGQGASAAGRPKDYTTLAPGPDSLSPH